MSRAPVMEPGAVVVAAATNPPAALARITIIHRLDAGGANTGTIRVPSTMASTEGMPPVAPT